MVAQRIRTGLLGLNQAGRLVLDSAVNSGLYDVVVIADKDIEAASKAASYCGAEACDDFRLAVSNFQLDAVIAAASLQSCAEHIRSAIGRKINILRVMPPARNYDELAGFAIAAQKENVIFAVASTARQRGSFGAFSDAIKKSQAESFSLLRAQCGPGFYQEFTERDPKVAGGGIILYSAYPVIDEILRNFGMPSQIYAMMTSLAPDRQQRLYVTEDTAVISLKYSDTFMATVTASKSFGPGLVKIQAYGKEKTVSLDGNDVLCYDSSGRVIEKQSFADREEDAVTTLLAEFAHAIKNPNPDEFRHKLSLAQSNLDNMAVIDAAYLSARTGMPESPAHIMELSQTAPNRYINKAQRSV